MSLLARAQLPFQSSHSPSEHPSNKCRLAERDTIVHSMDGSLIPLLIWSSPSFPAEIYANLVV